MENAEISSPKASTEKLQPNSNELEVISNPSLVLDPRVEDIPDVIYGRMLNGKSVNKVGLKNLFESLWQKKAGVEIEDYAEGIIILTFESEAVKNRIMRGQPWHFSGSYLILLEASAMVQITAEQFKRIPFWVHVNGIPPGLLAKCKTIWRITGKADS